MKFKNIDSFLRNVEEYTSKGRQLRLLQFNIGQSTYRVVETYKDEWLVSIDGEYFIVNPETKASRDIGYVTELNLNRNTTPWTEFVKNAADEGAPESGTKIKVGKDEYEVMRTTIDKRNNTYIYNIVVKKEVKATEEVEDTSAKESDDTEKEITFTPGTRLKKAKAKFTADKNLGKTKEVKNEKKKPKQTSKRQNS